MSLSNSSCAREAAVVATKIFNKTTTTTQHETLLKAASGDFDDYKLSFDPAARLKQHPMLPFFEKGRYGSSVGYGMRETRSITKYVKCGALIFLLRQD